MKIDQALPDMGPRCVEAGGRNYSVSVYETNASTGMTTFVVGVEGAPDTWRIDFKGTIDDLKEYLGIVPAIGSYDADLYLLEVMRALQRGDALSGFRSYYHGVLIDKGPDAGPEPWVSLGLALASALREACEVDYSEWVAAKVGEIAAACGDRSGALKAFEIAGVVVSDLGWIDESKAYFGRALAAVDDQSSPDDVARLRMNYGLSLVSLLYHLDFEPAADRATLVRSKSMLAEAEAQLLAARKLIEEGYHARRGERLVAIDLDLARIADLQGESEAAIRLLDGLQVREPKHRATRLIYRLAALKRLNAREQEPQYEIELRKAGEEFLASAQNSAEHACWYFLALGDAALEAGQPSIAVVAFRRAMEAVQMYAHRIRRAAAPSTAIGGLYAIDIAGRLQKALLSTPGERHQKRINSRDAFAVADTAKGRFFSRDLIWSQNTGSKLSPYISTVSNNLRNRLLRGTVDPRLVLADYEWFIEHEAGPTDIDLKKLTASVSTPVQSDDIKALLTPREGPVIFLSFYCTQNGTFLYIFDHPDYEPNIVGIDIGGAEVKRIARSLLTGIGGGGSFGYPKINPKQPEQHDIFFRDFTELGSLLEPLMEFLAPCKHLLISPHAGWHSLPVHALLLPLFWKRGLCPGISYVPNVKIASLIRQRSGNLRSRGFGINGLTTVPAQEDVDSLFRASHERLRAALRSSDCVLQEEFGRSATVERTLSINTQVAVHHILAHGRFEADRNAMLSSLLMSDGQELPSREKSSGENGAGQHLTASAFMAVGQAADHVTLQACSLGRSVAGPGDELWGMSRALLAAGTNSILAPMWDANLASSTELLTLFYQNRFTAGMSGSEALARAQWQLSATGYPGWSHFYHWGAFQYIGY